MGHLVESGLMVVFFLSVSHVLSLAPRRKGRKGSSSVAVLLQSIKGDGGIFPLPSPATIVVIIIILGSLGWVAGWLLGPRGGSGLPISHSLR